MSERDGRTRLNGVLTCVKSKIVNIETVSDTMVTVLLSHDRRRYLLSREAFSERELERASLRTSFFQLVDSDGRRSVCDIIDW